MPYVQLGSLDAYAFETLTVDATVGGIGFTASKTRQQLGTANVSTQSRGAAEVLVTVEGGPMRFTIDGTTVTSTVGHLLNVGDSFIVTGAGNIARFKAIRTTGVSATPAVTYYA